MLTRRTLMCLLLCGCADETVLVGKLPNPTPTADAADAADTADAVTEPTPEVPEPGRLDNTPLATFCAGHGVPLQAAACTAQRLFSHALCACGDVHLPGAAFLLDGFDSRNERYQPGRGTGSLAANGTVATWASETTVEGNVFLAGETPLQLGDAALRVAGDLSLNGTLVVAAGSADIARDLWIGGDIQSPRAAVRVGRDAHQLSGRSGAELLSVVGEHHSESALHVVEPCPCEPSSRLDIAGLVAQAREANDNAATGMSADALRIAPLLTDLVTLPCGRLFVEEIAVQAPSTYFAVADARSALFVAGDLSVSAPSTLYLGPQAGDGELDLFVAGDLRIAAGSTLSLGGTDAAPSAVRTYVAGQVVIEGTLLLHGALYAPDATLDCQTFADAPDWYGAVFARSIVRLGSSQLHYDHALAALDATCMPADESY
jgi:hypothetical protein